MSQSQMILVATGTGLCVSGLVWAVSQWFGGICPDPIEAKPEPGIEMTSTGAVTNDTQNGNARPDNSENGIEMTSTGAATNDMQNGNARPDNSENGIELTGGSIDTAVPPEPIPPSEPPIPMPPIPDIGSALQQPPNKGGGRQTRSRYKVKKRKSRKHK